MKTTIIALVCFICVGSVCLAEPPASPAPLRDLAPSEIDQLTLDVDTSSGQSISFRAFGVRYVLSRQLFYTRDMASHAADLIVQFRAAKTITVQAEATGDKGADGLPEFQVFRIQFHY